MRLLHARPGRVGVRARLRESGPDAGANPPPDSGEPVPLRHVPEDRGGDPRVARLIRTEKEVEGRFQEVWLVVEEDPLEQWPAGPLTTVGRGTGRKDGPQRVQGRARYTADLQLPGMLHAAVLRSPHARARVKKINLDGGRQAAGVRG